MVEISLNNVTARVTDRKNLASSLEIGTGEQWALAVDLPAVGDLHHPYGQFAILYRVDDAVIPLANTISFLA